MFLKRICLSGLTFVLLIALPALAAEGGTGENKGGQKENEVTDIYELTLEELMEVEVLVASKSAEKAFDAPSSVTVFTRKEIRNLGVQCLDDLLRFVPGFEVTEGRNNWTWIISRGLWSNLSANVLILINGHRLNTISGGTAASNYRLAVENIKQVEIIRGPGSALYGTDAVTGVINIVTLDDVTDVVVRLGDISHRSIAANVSKKLGEIHFSAFVKAFSDEGYRSDILTERFKDTGRFPANEGVRAPEKGITLNTGVKYKNFSIFARHFEINSKDSVQWIGPADGINHQYISQSAVQAMLKLDFNRLRMNLKTGYMRQRGEFSGLLAEFREADFLALAIIKAHYANFDLDARYDFPGKSRLSFGFSIAREGEKSNTAWTHLDGEFLGGLRFVDPSGPYNAHKSPIQRDFVGFYIQQKMMLGKRLTLYAGARYDRYEGIKEAPLSPRGALVFKTPFSSTIKVMYGEAFRVPNAEEQFINALGFQGNPDLGPEKIRTLELAYIQELKNFSGSLTYFHNHLKDKILTSIQTTAEIIYENIGFQKSSGLEVELKAAVGTLLVMANFTHFLERQDFMGPESMASFIFNFRGKRFNLNLNGVWAGRFYSDEGFEVEPHLLLCAKVDYSLKPSFRILATMRNIVGKEYSVAPGLLPTMNARGRTFTVGLECDF